MIRQRFITLQLVIDMVNALSQTAGIDQSAYAPAAVDAAQRLSEPLAEEAGMRSQFQSIEAAHASPEQRCDGFENHRGGMRGCVRRSTTPATTVPENSLAEAYLAASDPKKTLQTARAALYLSEHPECQYAWGQADGLHFCGLAHLRQGETELARQRLTAALDIQERLGHGRIAETRRALEELGGSSRSTNA